MTTQTAAEQAVAALLAQAGAAHGVYEASELNGVYDQNWPGWYAAYLVEHRLADLLDMPIAVERLRILLEQYDQEYNRERPGVSWPQFYATHLIAEV